MENIFVLYGENKEALLESRKDLINKYLDNQVDDFNLIKFNMMETRIEDLVYECRESGFFSNRKVVLAENSVFLQAKSKKIKVEHDLDLLLEYVSNTNPDVLLIFTCEEGIDSRKKINKKIKEVGKVINFENFKDVEISKYIMNYMNKEGIDITREIANFLIEYTRLDFAGIKRELEKLAIYCKDKASVEKQDIENLLVRSIEYDVFSLTEHLFKKDYTNVRKVFESLKLKGEEPIMLLGLIVSQLRVYYKVKILLRENYSQKDIASKLKIHPYRVQLAAQAIYYYSLEDLFDCMIMAKDCDKDLKSSYLNKYLILDLFINKLMEKLGK
ncbi:MAG: DNA polymerase III subunit delta [Gemella sp.]|nr:DNA polymerase III subunit delta [Gemella sp.]